MEKWKRIGNVFDTVKEFGLFNQIGNGFNANMLNREARLQVLNLPVRRGSYNCPDGGALLYTQNTVQAVGIVLHPTTMHSNRLTDIQKVEIVTHEIAHAIRVVGGKDPTHGSAWVSTHKAMGGTGQGTLSFFVMKPKVVGICLHCGTAVIGYRNIPSARKTPRVHVECGGPVFAIRSGNGNVSR